MSKRYILASILTGTVLIISLIISAFLLLRTPNDNLVLALSNFKPVENKTALNNSSFAIDGLEKMNPYRYKFGNEILLMSTQNANQCDIYKYEISNDSITQLTNNTDNSEIAPVMNEKYIVWQECNNFEKDDKIILYNKDTKNQSIISNPENRCINPTLYDDFILWIEYKRLSGKYKVGISGFKISSSELLTIKPIDYNVSMSYSCDGRNVVWTQYSDESKNDIYRFDLITRQQYLVCNNSENQVSPKVNGDVIVWEDHRNDYKKSRNNYERGDIYAYSISQNSEFPIDTRKGICSVSPIVKDKKIVYISQLCTNKSDVVSLVTLDDQNNIKSYGEVCVRESKKSNPKIEDNLIIWEERDNSHNNSSIYAYSIIDNSEFLLTVNGSSASIKDGICLWTTVLNNKLILQGTILSNISY